MAALEQPHPDRAHQVADVEQVAPVGALHAVDHRAEGGKHEEQAEHERAGGRPPLHPRGKRQRQQRQQQNPHPGAEEQAARDACVIHRPAPAFQVAFQAEQQQARHPGHHRKQDHQHRHFAQHVFGARERPRQVKRKRVVGEVGRYLAGSDERGQEQSHHALPAEQRKEEDHVDRNQMLRALRTDQAQRAGVVLDVNDDGADQRIEEGGEKEDGKKLPPVEIFEGVARNHQQARPVSRQRALIRPVGLLIDGHRRWRPPWL